MDFCQLSDGRHYSLMNLILFSLIVLLQSGMVLAQPIPKDHFSYQSRKLFYDAGKDWGSLTSFGPIRFKSEPQKGIKNFNSSSYFNAQIGFDSVNESYSFYGFGGFKYNNHYYAYLYPTYVNKTHKKNTFINDQDNRSGLGFENSWLTLQIGRGRESWGAGNDIQLALSENSGVYDYFLLGSDYGKFRVKYIHGFLENVETNINRYITARGFEWTNRRSFIIGFSETVIYSGKNRSIDIGYLNPMSSHLEIELNNRLNIIGNQSSNAVWQIHLDYLLMKNLRFSFNYLYDEFVFDPDIQIGKEHGKAHSLRLAYSPLLFSKNLLTLYTSLVNVGTPTFRHVIGTNNFVQDGRPLDWYRGSDGQEISFGINYFNTKDLIINIVTGLLQSGDETTINRIFEPFADYLKGPFPSGQVDNQLYFKTSLIFWWKENYSISNSFYWSKEVRNINLKLKIPLFKA